MKTRFPFILASLAVSATCLSAADSSTPLHVRALIDGRDQLVIRRDSIHWEHFDYWRPGRRNQQNEPTYFDTFAWQPSWPDTNDQHPGPSLSISATVNFAGTGVTMQIVSARSVVRILQQPDATNDQTLVVEFDDDAAGADAWYEIVLEGVSVNFSPPLSVTIGSIVLSWKSETNRTYQLQYTTNLFSSTWVDFGTAFQGTGSNIVVTNSDLSGPRRFYRIAPVP